MVFKKSNRLFYVIWLVMGLFQLGDAAGAQLLSQEPSENKSSSESVAAQLPVRISRGFFERQTMASMDFVSAANVSGRLSEVSWNEKPSDGSAAPIADLQPIAAFNDHLGCAEIKELPPLQLCFKIQDDVSSLTLAPGQMSLEGLDAVADLTCIAGTRFIGAQKNGSSGFTVSYQLLAAESARCKNAGGVLNLTLQQPI